MPEDTTTDAIVSAIAALLDDAARNHADRGDDEFARDLRAHAGTVRALL